MNRRLRSNIQKSKLYDPNALSLTQNTDMSHQKMWNQKIQQTKHIQQQKQIDRILFGIVKQRLFGQLLSQETRISTQGYYTLDKLNKQLVNNIEIKNRRKITPIKNQPTYDIRVSSRLKYKTLDTGRRPGSIPLSRGQNMQQTSSRRINRKNTIDLSPLSKTKRSFYLPKQFQISKVSNLNNYFKQLTNNFTTMLYDIKLTKQALIKYNKQKQIVSANCLQRFLQFFNFPGSVNIKQYSNWIQYVANCSMKESSFVIFQVLNESKNGMITTSDLFKILNDFPSTNSSDLEKELYQLTQFIKRQKSQIKNEEKQEAKPTVEEIIVRNHSLKLEDMRQLLKQSSQQLIKTDIFKSTTYHKSLYALQHNASVRQKNSQLEYTNQEQGQGKKRTMTSFIRQDGIKFGEYSNIFQYKRSKIFLLVLRLLIGQEGAALIE